MSNYGDDPQNYGNSGQPDAGGQYDGGQYGGSQYGGPANGGSYGAPQGGGNYGAQPPAGGGNYGTPPAGGGNYGGTPDLTQASKGFFGALFDFSFNHFVTPMIVKVVYVLATIGLAIGWLVLTITGFTDSFGSGLLVLILGALGAVIYLALIRMTLEFYLAIVRMSEDIHHRLK